MRTFSSVLIFCALAVLSCYDFKEPVSEEMKDRSLMTPEMMRSYEAAGEEREKDPASVDISFEKRNELWKAYENTPKDPVLDNPADPWIPLGPFGAWVRTQPGQSAKYSGKIFDVELTNSGFMRIGTGNGGLWQQPVIGDPFPISDQITSLSVGTIASHPQNSDIIYVGTGEVGRTTGQGVFKTTDGGNSWNNILPVTQPNSFFAVARILIDPNHPDTIHIAGHGTGNFNYRYSTNGGNSWFNVLANRPGTAITDLVMDPQNTSILYTSGWTINGLNLYKSTNAGASWQPMSSPNLPTTNIFNTSLAICKSRPNIVYAMIADSLSNLRGIYKTTDGGSSWTMLSVPLDILGGQGGHANAITVSPVDSNIVLAGGVSLIRSSNGGANWVQISGTYTHADVQSFKWRDNGNQLFMANDGGLAESNDKGITWNTNTNNFPISEVSFFDFCESQNNYMTAGLEHNGIVTTSNRGITWNMTASGDGSGAAIHPTDPSIQFMTVGVFLGDPIPFKPYRSTDFGLTWGSPIQTGITPDCGQWYTQIKTNRWPSNFSVYTNFCRRIYKLNSAGSGWIDQNMPMTNNSFINFSLDVMTLTGQVFAATTDTLFSNAQKVYTEIGGSWFDISPNIGKTNVMQKVRAAFMLTGIVRGTGNSTNKVYKMDAQNILTPAWTNITGTGLADYPLRDIQLDYNDTNRMVVGTQGWGCFITTNSGQQWVPWNEGLPKGLIITEMRMIDSTMGDSYVVISTYGRGLYMRKFNAKPIGITSQTGIVNSYALHQNYPNPFNPVTKIEFDIPKSSYVTIKIFDITGRLVYTLVNNEKGDAGKYSKVFHATGLSSGVYFLRMDAEASDNSGQVFTETKKMLLIK